MHSPTWNLGLAPRHGGRNLPTTWRRCSAERAVGCGQLDRTGEEVGVQVGVGRKGDLQPRSRPAHGPQVPTGIHGQGTSVAEVDR